MWVLISSIWVIVCPPLSKPFIHKLPKFYSVESSQVAIEPYNCGEHTWTQGHMLCSHWLFTSIWHHMIKCHCPSTFATSYVTTIKPKSTKKKTNAIDSFHPYASVKSFHHDQWPLAFNFYLLTQLASSWKKEETWVHNF